MGTNTSNNSSNNNNTTEFNGKKEYLETVKYMGELRIIGQIVENINSKVILGYVIMTEKTKKMKAYNVLQTRWLLGRYKFVNAKLADDKIINTECAMDRLMKFDKNIAPLETNKSMIIGRITLDGRPHGFRVLSPRGIIVDLSEDDLLEYNDDGIEFVNAKLVERAGSKPYISAIKQEFTSIEKRELKDTLRKLNKGVNYRHQRKVEKILSKTHYMKESLCNIEIELLHTNIISTKDLLITNKSWDDQNKAKIMEIMVKECMPQYYNNNIPEDKKELAIRIVKAYKDGELGTIYKNYDKYDRDNNGADLAVLLLSQVLSSDKDDEYKIYERAYYKRRIIARKYNKKLYCYDYEYKPDFIKNKMILFKKLDELNLLTPSTKRLMSKKLKYFKQLESRAKLLSALPQNIDEAIEIKTLKLAKFDVDREFKNSSTITNLGFSINKESLRSKIVDTQNGTKLIRYLVDFIPDYEKYLAKATCLGDLVLLAKIELVLKYHGHSTWDFKGKSYYNYTDPDSDVLIDIEYPEYSADENEKKNKQLALAEMLLAILALYRPDLASTYIEDKAKVYPEFNNMLPGIDLDVKTDFELARYCETFYKSGATMLEVEDNKFIDMRHRSINVRGAKEKILIRNSTGYKAITEELGAVINMITSENCSNEIIENKLLNLNCI